MRLLIFFTIIFIFLGLFGLREGSIIGKALAQADAPLNNNPYTPNKSTTGAGSLPKAATSVFCTKVGNATGANPCPSPGTTGAGGFTKLPPGTSASCPIPGGKIGCGSYGPPEPWGGFHGSCRADGSGNGGHCNAIYQVSVGICLNRENSGNLIRTAKSIDVANNSRPGDPVYLPTIKDRALKWYYRGEQSAGGSFGYMRVFQSENTPEGIYTLHFVHVNPGSPSFSVGQELTSGDVGATLFNLVEYIHVHVTVGLNVEGDPFANNLQAYSPGWLFADRDLKMCTGG